MITGNNFTNIYSKSSRLATAVFTIANVIDSEEDLKSRLKKLSLEIISMTVSLKESDNLETKRLIIEIEKHSLLLMSLIDISAITGLISSMNGNIIKEEFQSFISAIKEVFNGMESNKNLLLQDVFGEKIDINSNNTESEFEYQKLIKRPANINTPALRDSVNGNNGSKRKETRKITILNFIKGHTDAGIKDIVPNIVGCSEKTIQRELIDLIKEGKILKKGERRWSRYSLK